MKSTENRANPQYTRRSILRTGMASAASAAIGVGSLTKRVFGQSGEEGRRRLSSGDAAILRFLAALEILETDLWQQYNELGGVQDDEVPGGTGSDPYTKAQQIGRLTNLMQLTVDTSWWTRYRSREENPDLDPQFMFPQAVPGLMTGQFPAIPRTDDDLDPPDHLQAIANTAGFHFAFIEQGGTSLYPSLAQRVSAPEVLRILLSIGPTETMHFQTWHDKAGNAPPLVDPTNGLEFPDLNATPFGGEDFSTNLIMPEPVPFLSRKFPVCSIIRPTETKGAAIGAANALTADGLFSGQSPAFFELLHDLAADADRARGDR